MIGVTLLLLCIVLALSIPVGIGLGLLGLLLSGIYSPLPMSVALGELTWSTSNSFILVAVPLYIMLGEIVLRGNAFVTERKLIRELDARSQPAAEWILQADADRKRPQRFVTAESWIRRIMIRWIVDLGRADAKSPVRAKERVAPWVIHQADGFLHHPVAARGITRSLIDDLGRGSVDGEFGAPVIVPIPAGEDAAKRIDVRREVLIDRPSEPHGADIAAEVERAIEPASPRERNAHAGIAAVGGRVTKAKPPELGEERVRLGHRRDAIGRTAVVIIRLLFERTRRSRRRRRKRHRTVGAGLNRSFRTGGPDLTGLSFEAGNIQNRGRLSVRA